MIESYPKAEHLRDRDALLSGPVVVEEKVDGSQFSFRRDGKTTWCRSKSVPFEALNYEGPFKQVVDAVAALDLPEGLTFRGEYLQRPRHNVLAYDRVPKHHVVIWDVQDTAGRYVPRAEKEGLCRSFDLELVPQLFEGEVTRDVLVEALTTMSMLGGQRIEGVFVKSYDRPHPKGEPLWACKLVAEQFQEVAKRSRIRKEKHDDPLDGVLERYRTESRWMKAIQHLRDRGTLTNSRKDIGNLIKEIQEDVLLECVDDIKREVFDVIKKRLMSTVIDGFPQWYQAHDCDPINWTAHGKVEPNDVVNALSQPEEK